MCVYIYICIHIPVLSLRFHFEAYHIRMISHTLCTCPGYFPKYRRIFRIRATLLPLMLYLGYLGLAVVLIEPHPTIGDKYNWESSNYLGQDLQLILESDVQNPQNGTFAKPWWWKFSTSEFAGREFSWKWVKRNASQIISWSISIIVFFL